MGFFKSLVNYATRAWRVIAGIPGDVGSTLADLWKFAASQHTLLDWLIGTVERNLHGRDISVLGLMVESLEKIGGLFHRTPPYIWAKQVNPVRINLTNAINRLRRWTTAELNKQLHLMWRLYRMAIWWTNHLVAIERRQRIAAVLFAREFSVRLVKGALGLVNSWAARGYESANTERRTAITTIADDLATRNPLIKDLISDVVKLALDAAEVEDPLLRAALGWGLSELIGKLGIDKVMGDLMGSLITDLTGTGHPKGLSDVTADTARRLSALEQQWADFMVHGGPEQMHEGDELKALGSPAVEVAAVEFFALAVADPVAWATAVNDTAGAVVNRTASLIEDLIRKA